jgi:hypothetical protein
MMRNYIALFLLIGTVVGITSCKKCYTCTFEDQVYDTVRVEDFCEKGFVLENTLDTYDRNNWKCVED